MYERAERVADEVWAVVLAWKPFERDTVGKQITRSADSIGVNLAESSGRFHPRDVIRFVYYARGSLKETRYWLRRALHRDLIPQTRFDQWMDELTQLAKEINKYIGHQRKRLTKPTSKPTSKPTNQLTRRTSQ